jgi:hypothetical protein
VGESNVGGVGALEPVDVGDFAFAFI